MYVVSYWFNPEANPPGEGTTISQVGLSPNRELQGQYVLYCLLSRFVDYAGSVSPELKYDMPVIFGGGIVPNI